MDRTSLGVYQLRRVLGRGAMGTGCLAHDPRLDRLVALKVLSQELAANADLKERFFSEARSSSALNHPNITTIHEIGEADGAHFIAFEYVEGETLEALVARKGRLDFQEIAELGLPLASAMSYAHEHGIIHRDLKPANIVVSNLGSPKILDFGLAKAVPKVVDTEAQTQMKLTQAGMVMGTIAYMAPEQALGELVDVRTDVFAFGCILHEMAAGQPPFLGGSATQVIDRLLHEDPPPLERIRPDLPVELNRIVAKALRKKPEERYQHMDGLAADLRHLGRQSGGGAEGEPERRTEARPRSSRGIVAALGAAVAAFSLAGLVALLLTTDHQRQPEDTVAVMYFDNLADVGDSDRLGWMLAELVTSELAAQPDLRVVSRQRLHDVAQSLPRPDPASVAPVPSDPPDPIDTLDRRVATEVARKAGVTIMVVGQVVALSERVLATAELVDVASGESIASRRADGASPDEIFSLAASLGQQLSEELGGGERFVSRSSGTRMVAAYRHYLQGESYLVTGQMESAVQELSEAVRLDPDFALAQFRLSMAARWLSDTPLSHQAARRAVALVAKAPERLRDVIEANGLYQDGAYAQAIPLLTRVLEREPDQKDALYILSQIYVHSLRDGDPERAIELLERLLEVDADFHQVYDRLALSYLFVGRAEKARAWLDEWESRRPDKVQGLRSVLASFEGQPEETLGFGQTFSWIEGPLFQASAAMMASRWELARGLVDRDLEDWRADHLRAWAYRNRAALHTYVGEFDQAIENYRRAGTTSGFRTHEGATAGVSASALQQMAELLHFAGETGAAREQAERALAIQPESWRSLYYAGKMALFNDDPESAGAYLERLRSLPASATSPSARMYVEALEAETLLAAGDADAARKKLARLVESFSLLSDWASTCSSAGAAIRDGLVRAHLAAGDMPAVERGLEDLLASGPERIDHPVLFTAALYRLGIAKLDRGEREPGRRLLERFLKQWGSSDWELPEVEAARARLVSERSERPETGAR